jgi:hypothetical protein
MKFKILSIALFVLAFSTQTVSAQVRGKAVTQHKRIKKGVRSGELTPAEAANVRNDQREIRQEVRDAKSDGTVTRDERKDIKQDQRQASRKIHRKKNNNRDRN